MKRRIVVLADEAEVIGGLQTAARNLIGAFQHLGHSAELLGVRRARGTAVHRSLYPATPAYSSLRALSHRFRLLSGNRVERALLWERQRARSRLARWTADADVVIAFNVFAGELLASIPRPPEQLRITQWHNSFEAFRSRGEFARLVRVSDHFDQCLALTKEDADKFGAAGVKRISFLPNANSLDPLDEVPERSDKRVVALGRLVEEKGFRTLLDAWSRVVCTIDDWSLEIYGSGPERDTLRQDLERLALPSNILRGETRDVRLTLTGAGLFVLPSQFEGQPMTIIEAMSQGVPCIATDSSPGVNQLLGQGRIGVLVPVGDSAALADGLLTLMSDESERRNRAALGLAESTQFHPDTIAKRWLSMFESLKATPST